MQADGQCGDLRRFIARRPGSRKLLVIPRSRARRRALTHERAIGCFDTAVEGVILWARESGDSETIDSSPRPSADGNWTSSPAESGTAPAAVVNRFKELLRLGVRAEVLVKPGQDEQDIIGREAKVLLDSLAQAP